MQYKIIIIILFIIYIYTGAIRDYLNSSENMYLKEIQQEIIINEKDIDVFEQKNLDEITITDKKIKIWNIAIAYTESNYDNIKKKLTSSGYKIKNDQKKMYYLVGPFSDLSHAKEESKKLSKLHGLKNKVINLSF